MALFALAFRFWQLHLEQLPGLWTTTPWEASFGFPGPPSCLLAVASLPVRVGCGRPAVSFGSVRDTLVCGEPLLCAVEPCFVRGGLRPCAEKVERMEVESSLWPTMGMLPQVLLEGKTLSNFSIFGFLRFERSNFGIFSEIMTGATLTSRYSGDVRNLMGSKMASSRGLFINFEAHNVQNGEIPRLAVSVFKKISKIMTGATLKDRYSEFVTVMTGKIKAQSRAVFISFGAQDVGNVKSSRPKGSLCDTFSEVYGLAGATLENRSFRMSSMS